MNNTVYYGQYSLRHWVSLILKKNITLPEYQRHFVWTEEKVKTLIETLKNNQFVPPVTIGKFRIESIDENLILDGQQRLTSIFLAYLSLYPELEKQAESQKELNDDINSTNNIHKWTFARLTEKGTNKEQIISSLEKESYKTINYKVDDDFFDNNFIGFSYLIPSSTDEKSQLRYYSSVFRSINIQGMTLLPQESRASLYFLDKDLSNLFTPKFAESVNLTVVGNNKTKLDFVRILALTSHFKNDGKVNNVAIGYKSNMETYYEEYIYSVVENKKDKFGQFSNIYPDRKYTPNLEKMSALLDRMGAKRDFKSIIEQDMYMFGMTYIILLEKKSIKEEGIDDLKNEIEALIEEMRKDKDHGKSPGLQRYLRLRLEKSIEAFNKHAA